MNGHESPAKDVGDAPTCGPPATGWWPGALRRRLGGLNAATPVHAERYAVVVPLSSTARGVCRQAGGRKMPVVLQDRDG